MELGREPLGFQLPGGDEGGQPCRCLWLLGVVNPVHHQFDHGSKVIKGAGGYHQHLVFSVSILLPRVGSSREYPQERRNITSQR